MSPIASLIRNLQKRFPKARILGHRDLPDIHKACLCNDIRMDQNAEKSFQNLDDMPEISGMIMQGGKTLPQIQGRPLQGIHRYEPESGHPITGAG